MKNKKLIWKLCVAAVIVIILITYSPLITPEGKYTPSFLHLPYSLWTTILLAFILVALTYIGGRALPDNEEDAI